MSERTLFLGCDPGRTGGLALIDESRTCVTLALEKATETEVARFLRTYLPNYTFATIERVWGRLGDTPKTAGVLCQSYGFLRGLLAAFDIPRQEVTPQKWQGKLGVPGDDKPALRQFMSQRYPGTRWTNATSAAGCLAHYTYITHTRVGLSDHGDSKRDGAVAGTTGNLAGEAVSEVCETATSRQLRQWLEEDTRSGK